MTNRLAQCQSLYLRKHAENPIDWWSWSEEALETAKSQNKPIFLSIGYASCHWCTVMEGEAFSNLVIADYLNTHFLPIKVDREERPDIDSIYMQALQAMTGEGGWPLNIFLTPDQLIPFYGGTYFPLESRYGRPGFINVLQSVRRFYDQDKEKLGNFTTELLQVLQNSTLLERSELDLQNPALLYRGIETCTQIIAASEKDFGRPSFPMIPYANFVLQGSRLPINEPKNSREIAYQRGENLALGGIYDHVAGGFHRYTVDATWTVPHFEKMLYDNGQIVEYLANLWSADQPNPIFQRAIAGTVQWLQREMTAPEGYFYASQDADNFIDSQSLEPEEGDFYAWDYQELAELLTADELTQLQSVFYITATGNFDGKNVLQRHQGGVLSTEIEEILTKLFVVRYGTSPENLLTFPPAINNEEAKNKHWAGRIPPVTDTKMIVAWNSLMISGLARAYAVFSTPMYWTLATQATQFILDHQWQENRLHRLNYQGKPTTLAQSEDYAFLIKALLDLQTANPTENYWLEKAIAIQEEFDQFFWSLELGGYYNNSLDNSQDLLIRERSYQDNATPSANGIAIANLVRLAGLTDNLDYLAQAEQALTAFSYVLKQSPQACPSLFVALDHYRFGNTVRSQSELLSTLLSHYLPVTRYQIVENLPNQAIAIVCQGLSCLEPAINQEQLMNQLQSLNVSQ
ncbi:MAG: thioredoxin domain-containing protein [Snowella sp.]|nr:thioredoxin domain-containing protein [Snowella sp.]